MRCITKEMLEKREKADSVYNLILHAPKPDFTELDKECAELKAWITEEHKKDKQIMMEALKANGRL
ncbi:MAG: hypothetical protein UHW86_09640 [Spirochaetota bacterium]|jgi:hypothetical protein|nr:hypothetical protein [Spirochaetota bacterium]